MSELVSKRDKQAAAPASSTRPATSDDILRRVPPQNLEAEQSVLGAVLLDNAAISRIVEVLQVDDFYREAHRGIFRAMLELDAKREPVDAITLTDILRRDGNLEQIGGPAYIAELASIVPTAANCGYYASIVHGKAILRRIGTVATDIASSSYEGVADYREFAERAASAMFEACRDEIQASRMQNIAEAVRLELKHFERAYENRANPSILGLATGFIDIDASLGGLEPGNFAILAARPSMGKTALACNIIENAATENLVAFFSLEMSSSEIVSRFLCGRARIDLLRARRGYLRDADFPKLAHAAADLSEMKIWLDDSPSLTVNQIRHRCQKIVREQKRPIGLIVVDYLQLVRPAREFDSREREVSEISKSLKAIAKEFKAPVLALSQLSRQVESRQDKRPILADLRESGSLEQDADVVAFIYRDEVYKGHESREPGVAEVIVAKQRNGPQFTAKLTFIKNYTRFENYTPETGVFEDTDPNTAAAHSSRD